MGRSKLAVVVGPSFWSVAHDLDQYVREGLLIEISITCSLNDIFKVEMDTPLSKGFSKASKMSELMAKYGGETYH